ncbi:MAG TPA: glycosyltransferase family 39 protein [Phototrophicaceae bacterium]|nr:glycosyltransferase family 39 protein [Phototrophicaceae bacterium]
MTEGLRGENTNRAPQFERQHLVLALAIGVLLVVFALTLTGLTRESLWNDEAWTDWAVRSPYLADTLARIQGDVHPPLYFLLLDGWTLAAGDSVFALRLPSILFGLLTLAAAYAVGVRLFDRPTGLMTIILLGTASFFVYYTREARMYSLLLALGTLATWAYLRWSARPSLARASSYGLLLALLLYTHYAGALIILTHFLHGLLTAIQHPAKLLRKLPHGLLPYLLALLLFAPWLPVFLSQMRANPHGPLALPLPTDWGTAAGLLLIVTGGYGGLMLLPFGLGTALPRLRQYGNAILLLLLWLLLTPSLLLILNASVAPVYQVRYTIAALPAGALLIAYGLRHIGLPLGPTAYRRRLTQAVTMILLLALVQVQLSTHAALWPPQTGLGSYHSPDDCCP